MAAALGQVRIKVRSCVIAAAARGVSMAVRAPITRNTLFGLFKKTASKDHATGTIIGTHTQSLRRGTCSGAGRRGAACVLSQGERALLNMREQAGCPLANEVRWSPKVLIKSRPVVLRRVGITGR